MKKISLTTGCAFILAAICGLAALLVLLGGGGSSSGSLDSSHSPGRPGDDPGPVQPCLCSPTPLVPPTEAPTITPYPTPPLNLPPTAVVPTPLLAASPVSRRPPDPPPPADPNQTPPPDLTATQAAYEGESTRWAAEVTVTQAAYQATVTAQAGRYLATQTAASAHWQATSTVLAAYWQATLTALVPTPTPVPPTPVGGGPYGWPISPSCTVQVSCAEEGGVRVVTQDYGCTWLITFEYACPWCSYPTNDADFRWQANRRFQPSLVFGAWHRGIDLDAGVGEQVWVTIDGVVLFADWTSSGYMVKLGDVSGKFYTAYLHLSQIGTAVNPATGQSLGRVWQAGDPIKHFDVQGRHMIVGITGGDGVAFSSGSHLHYQVGCMTQLGIYDCDPVRFMNRSGTDPLPTIPVPIGNG